MSHGPILALKSVSKTYQLGQTTIRALQSLDLELEVGEFTALIGASGSGKSTLLNIIGCLDTPDAGQVYFRGQDITAIGDKDRSALRNHEIGFIFQSFNLISVLSVYENIELPLVIRSDIGDTQRQERVLSAIRDVGLEDFIHYPPDKLSGGQRQRVAIARALVTHPSLVLADEPTANLDSVTSHKIIDLLLDLNQKRKITFLFCSHDEKLINRVGKVLRIQDGSLVS